MLLVTKKNRELCLYMQRMVHTCNKSIDDYTIVNGKMNNIRFMAVNQIYKSEMHLLNLFHFLWKENVSIKLDLHLVFDVPTRESSSKTNFFIVLRLFTVFFHFELWIWWWWWKIFIWSSHFHRSKFKEKTSSSQVASYGLGSYLFSLDTAVHIKIMLLAHSCTFNIFKILSSTILKVMTQLQMLYSCWLDQLLVGWIKVYKFIFTAVVKVNFQ